MARKGGFGTRGLEELLTMQNHDGMSGKSGKMAQVPVENIQHGRYQPRKQVNIDELEELAASIRAQGLIQPVILRKLAPNQYELIAGERRWRAAQIAGLKEIPAVIREIENQAAAAMSLIENIQREDLKPLEEVDAFMHLIEEFGLTHQQVADAVGRSRAAVSNLLRLRELGELPKRLLEGGELEMGHARTLLGLTEIDQAKAAQRIVKEHLNVRQTERLVKHWNRKHDHKEIKLISRDAQQLEQKISERLGAHVQINSTSKGNGKLILHFNNLSELNEIIEHLLKGFAGAPIQR